jgi:arylsulfatase A-like enzyme
MKSDTCNRRNFLKAAAVASVPAIMGGGIASRLFAQSGERLNVVLIFVDDLGYGGLGCYGQEKSLTPHLDKMAAEGIRFTQNYCGGATCHPSRGTLLSGCHQGNPNRELPGWKENQEAMVPRTLGGLMKKAGYATCHIGKWGGMPWMGGRGPKGPKDIDPVHWGFDYCCGNLNHSETAYFQGSLWEITPTSATEIPNSSSSYGGDVMLDKTLKWLDANKDKPFFLYWANNLIHGPFHYPTDKEINDYYKSKSWNDERYKQYGAMTTRLDKEMGALIQKLKDLGVADKTIVLFTSDQGPTEDGPTTGFFTSAGPLRGKKRSIYEGCFRVPMIVWGPGNVPAGKVSDYLWAHWDILPTCAHIAGIAAPLGISGRSVLPTLLGQLQKPVHEYLYFDYKDVAVRSGKWKLYKMEDGTYELYDLEADIGETNNIASANPDIVNKLNGYLANPNQDATTGSTGILRRSHAGQRANADMRAVCRANGRIEIAAPANTRYSVSLHDSRGRTVWESKDLAATRFVIPKKMPPGRYTATFRVAGSPLSRRMTVSNLP